MNGNLPAFLSFTRKFTTQLTGLCFLIIWSLIALARFHSIGKTYRSRTFLSIEMCDLRSLIESYSWFFIILCIGNINWTFDTYPFVTHKFFVAHSLVWFQLGHWTFGRFSITITFSPTSVVVTTFKLTSFEGTIVATARSLLKWKERFIRSIL